MNGTLSFAWLLPGILTLASTAVAPSYSQELNRGLQYNIRDVTMSLRRSPCFGTCPSYTLVIHGDGSGVYGGRAFVAVEGMQTFHLERDSIVALLKAFWEIDFQSLKTNYTEGRTVQVLQDGTLQFVAMNVSDVPLMFLKLEIGDSAKEIEFNHMYGLRSLIDLANRMDTMTNSSQWIQKK